jgi:hypothetical protein
MPEGFDNFELAAMISVIRSCERIMGLSAQQIGHDSDGLFIHWAYPDGEWAGTTCCEMPLSRTIEKLQRQLDIFNADERAAA